MIFELILLVKLIFKWIGCIKILLELYLNELFILIILIFM